MADDIMQTDPPDILKDILNEWTEFEAKVNNVRNKINQLDSSVTTYRLGNTWDERTLSGLLSQLGRIVTPLTQTDIAQFTKKLDDGLATLDKEIKDCRALMADQKIKEDELNKAREELDEEKTRFQQEMKDLQDRCKASYREKKERLEVEYQEKMKDAEVHRQNSINAANQSSQEFHTATAEKAKYTQSIEDMRVFFDANKQEMKRLRKKDEDFERDVTALTTERDNLKTVMELRHTGTATNLDVELARRNGIEAGKAQAGTACDVEKNLLKASHGAELLSVRQNLKEAQDTIKKWQVEVGAMKQQLQHELSLVNTLRSEIVQLKQGLSKMTAELQDCRKEEYACERLQQVIQGRHDEIDELNKEANQSAIDFRALSKDYDDVESNRDRYQKERNECRQSLADEKQRNTELDSDYQTALNDRDRYQKEFDDCQQLLGSFGATEDQINEALKMVGEHQLFFEDLSAEEVSMLLAEAKELVDQLRIEGQQLREKLLEDIKEAEDQRDVAVAKSVETYANCQQAKDTLQDEIDDLNAKLQQQQKHCEDQKDDLRRKLAELDKKLKELTDNPNQGRAPGGTAQRGVQGGTSQGLSQGTPQATIRSARQASTQGGTAQSGAQGDVRQSFVTARGPQASSAIASESDSPSALLGSTMLDAPRPSIPRSSRVAPSLQISYRGNRGRLGDSEPDSNAPPSIPAVVASPTTPRTSNIVDMSRRLTPMVADFTDVYSAIDDVAENDPSALLPRDEPSQTRQQATPSQRGQPPQEDQRSLRPAASAPSLIHQATRPSQPIIQSQSPADVQPTQSRINTDGDDPDVTPKAGKRPATAITSPTPSPPKKKVVTSDPDKALPPTPDVIETRSTVRRPASSPGGNASRTSSMRSSKSVVVSKSGSVKSQKTSKSTMSATSFFSPIKSMADKAKRTLSRGDSNAAASGPQNTPRNPFRIGSHVGSQATSGSQAGSQAGSQLDLPSGTRAGSETGSNKSSRRKLTPKSPRRQSLDAPASVSQTLLPDPGNFQSSPPFGGHSVTPGTSFPPSIDPVPSAAPAPISQRHGREQMDSPCVRTSPAHQTLEERIIGEAFRLQRQRDAEMDRVNGSPNPFGLGPQLARRKQTLYGLLEKPQGWTREEDKMLRDYLQGREKTNDDGTIEPNRPRRKLNKTDIDDEVSYGIPTHSVSTPGKCLFHYHDKSTSNQRPDRKFMIKECVFTKDYAHRRGRGCYFLSFANVVAPFVWTDRSDLSFDVEATRSRMRSGSGWGQLIDESEKRWYIYRRLSDEDLEQAKKSLQMAEEERRKEEEASQAQALSTGAIAQSIEDPMEITNEGTSSEQPAPTTYSPASPSSDVPMGSHDTTNSPADQGAQSGDSDDIMSLLDGA